jgi:hypothetical protein
MRTTLLRACPYLPPVEIREWSTGVALRRLRRILASLPFPDKSGSPPIHSRTILKPPRARRVYRSIAAQNSVAVCHSHSSHSRAGHRLCGAGSGNASAIIASTVAIALVLPIRCDEWVIALPFKNRSRYEILMLHLTGIPFHSKRRRRLKCARNISRRC